MKGLWTGQLADDRKSCCGSRWIKGGRTAGRVPVKTKAIQQLRAAEAIELLFGTTDNGNDPDRNAEARQDVLEEPGGRPQHYSSAHTIP